MKKQALQYYMHDGPRAFRFELAGYLNDESAVRLDQDWRTASSVIGDRRLTVDITFVTGADSAGLELIARWHREGARLVANSKSSSALAESIVGEPLPETGARAQSSLDGTWLPFRASFVAPALNVLLLLSALIFPVTASAANLKPETVAAWNDYVRAADTALRDRVRPGGSFLWTFENADRAAKVRAGEIVVAPVPGHAPKKVPGGLIHDWMGAAFLPDRTIEDVLEVTRDYDHYKQFYGPVVVDSKAIARSGSGDRFSMLLMNNAFLMKTALDADYESSYVRLDSRRSYSISRTTRVQEIEDFGQPGEHRVPEGEGGGYIWKLYSVTRFEQRDSGVYVELEAIALSRDIPVAVRFVVDPIVRRLSRNSLLTSIRQTEDALRGEYVAVAAGSARPATSAGHLQDISAAIPVKASAFVGNR